MHDAVSLLWGRPMITLCLFKHRISFVVMTSHWVDMIPHYLEMKEISLPCSKAFLNLGNVFGLEGFKIASQHLGPVDVDHAVSTIDAFDDNSCTWGV